MESLRWLGAGAGQVLPWVTTGEGEGRGADQSPVRNLDAARTARGGKAMTRPGSSIAESTPAVWGKSGPSLANTDRRRGGRRAGVSSETGRNSDVTRNTADRGKKATAGRVQAPRRRAAVSAPPRACPPMVDIPRPPQQFPSRPLVKALLPATHLRAPSTSGIRSGFLDLNCIVVPK